MKGAPDRMGLGDRLLALAAAEAGSASGGGPVVDPAERVCERLGAILTSFAGASGARALLGRALALAAVGSPALAAVKLDADGTLSGFDSLDGEARAEAGRALVGEFLGLLATLIGEPLLRRLAAQAWPDLNGETLDHETENTP